MSIGWGAVIVLYHLLRGKFLHINLFTISDCLTTLDVTLLSDHAFWGSVDCIDVLTAFIATCSDDLYTSSCTNVCLPSFSENCNLKNLLFFFKKFMDN